MGESWRQDPSGCQRGAAGQRNGCCTSVCSSGTKAGCCPTAWFVCTRLWQQSEPIAGSTARVGGRATLRPVSHNGHTHDAHHAQSCSSHPSWPSCSSCPSCPSCSSCSSRSSSVRGRLFSPVDPHATVNAIHRARVSAHGGPSNIRDQGVSRQLGQLWHAHHDTIRQSCFHFCSPKGFFVSKAFGGQKVEMDVAMF